MRPVTPRFLDTITGSHRMVARARVVAPGQTGTTPTGTEIPIVSGDVQADATAEVRSSLDMTTTAAWPTSPSGLLTPYGNELFIERGVVYGDGVREWVSLGYFRIESVDQEDVPDGPIRIAGRDRMAGIIDAELVEPRQYAASATVAAVVSDLVWEVYPTIGIVIGGDFDPNVATLGGSRIVERNRYEFLLAVAKSFGCVMFFDHNGNFKMIPAPNPADPVWTISHGRRGVLARMSRSLNRVGVYNAWVATGEQLGDAAPAYGVAYDLDPASPSRWGGPFGPVPKFFSSSMIATDAQATAAAQAMRDREIGLPYNVTFGLVPNVALEVDDSIGLTYSDHANPEIHVIDKLTYPLVSSDAMTGATRVARWTA